MDNKTKFNIDSIVTFMLLKRLLASIEQSKAYQLGLVSQTGKIIRKPETEDEKAALSPLDRLVFKLKRMLGPKMGIFNNFLWVSTMSTDLYDKLAIKGTVEQRAEVIRIQKDLAKLLEKYDCSFNDISSLLINEAIREKQYE